MSGMPPADGDPVDMSEFTSGERYSSEDMYRDFPHLRPGDRVAVEIGGVLYTDTIKAAEPVVYPRLPAGKRLLRALTPPRWRKPLQPVRNDPLQRAYDLTAKAGTIIDGLIRSEVVKVPWWRRALRAAGLEKP